jgi:hypothetical protein
MIRFFWRFLIFILISVTLLVGSGFVIGYYYQDDVKEYIVGELNKELNTEIIIDGKDIDFTVLKNFPLASLDFKNVKALDAIQSKRKDTLFTAGEISFQFNLIDVFKKNYHIKKIEVDKANFRIRIDKDGNDNYHFWKQSTDTANAGFSFALEKIVLNQVHFSFKDYKANETIDFTINQSDLSGNISDKKYSMQSTSDLFINTVKIDSTRYLTKKNIHSEIALNIDNVLMSYKIDKAKIKIEDVVFEVVGNISNSNHNPILNLGFHGKDMDIKSVLSLIPAKYKGVINDYESSGEFYLDASVQGSIAQNNSPQIVADFGIKHADITQLKDHITLNNVNLKGHYSNGNKNSSDLSKLSLSPFSASIENGSISGNLSLTNLDNPSFYGNVKANFNIEVLQKFIKMDTLEMLNGQLKMDASFSGTGENLSSGNYENINTSGDLIISGVNIKLKNNNLPFSNINGDFKFDNNDLAVNKLFGNAGNSDFELKGFFRNMIGFVLKENQNITIEASLKSKNVNLNELLSDKQGSSNSKSKYELKFSEHIDLNLNSEIAHLEFRKFDATNIYGVIKLKNKKMVVDPITLSTMNGSITASGMIDGTDSTKILITCFADLNKINITKMFDSFENFGQTSITEKNIKGLATAKIQFASIVSPELIVDLDKLYAGVDMTIENGELNNVESMKSLSRFIELKDLENVRFSTLKNQIEIKNQVIHIPKMEVKSNAINIIASGTHTFNNEINYKIKLSLNELLSKKAKQSKKQNDEFGEVADDGLGRTNLFLSMTGTVDKPIIKYDSKSAIQNIKQDLKVEKQTLKTILKDEFGLFKKDSSLNSKKPVPNTKFIIKWDEADKKEEKKELKPPKNNDEEDY